MSTTREELVGTVYGYLDALAANDPSRLALASSVKYTENGQAIPLGYGLWANAEGREAGGHYFADPQTGQIGFLGVVRELGNPAMLGLRLKVECPSTGSGRAAISEVEHVIVRQRERFFEPKTLLGPRPQFLEVLPPSDRTPRAEMIRVTDTYFEGIQENNGDLCPLTDDCVRFENGIWTANRPAREGDDPDNPMSVVGRMKVREQLSSGFCAYINPIRDRRVLAVDEERGLTYAMVIFDHAGKIKYLDVPGRGRVEMSAGALRPASALIAEVFKIRRGQVEYIEAVLDIFPYGMKSGWE